MIDSFENASPVTAARTAPHSIEAEEYLLACCLLDGKDTLSSCIEKKVQPGAFYSPANRLVYEKLIEMYDSGKDVDLAVLAEELKVSKQLDEVGGYAFLTQISGMVPTTAQAGYFIEKLRELHILRELIKTATGAVENCYNFQGDIRELADKVEREIFAVTQQRVGDGLIQAKGPMLNVAAAIERMLTHKGEINGIASGYKDLDKLTYGFQKKDMIVLAARPSMGKTALALNIAEHASMPAKPTKKPETVLIFSLEMSTEQLLQRMACSRAKVNLKMVREGLISKNGDEMRRLNAAMAEISRAPIYIDDASSPTIMEIRAKSRRMAQKMPIGLIVIDYLGLIAPMNPRVPREQQVAESSRGAKAMAKELNVPVLLLSQLSRDSDKENRTPKLSDLRESGAIEQDADVVLFLARPKDADEKFQVAADKAELILAKQRNGPVGDLMLTFLRDITRFENYTQ